MLKLPKGLKKKKKGKKSKKDQELFTEEELEQYRREHQHQSIACSSTVPSDSEDHSGGGEKSENDEEWSKFAALTSGIDSVLKKTQGDLDRIKSTSFFQKVPTKVEQEKREQEERHRREKESLDEVNPEANNEEENSNAEKLINAVVELAESGSNSEVEETDIFDTGYIDAIASGELPIAYVPESPVTESFEGEDPFDTSYADKVIKGPEVSKRGKKLVSIGSAVEVLTGRVECAGVGHTRGNRQRRVQPLLLLKSFDDGEQHQEEATRALGETLKATETLSLLDESDNFHDKIAHDLTDSLRLDLQNQYQDKTSEKEREDTLPPNCHATLDLEEFDELKNREPYVHDSCDLKQLEEEIYGKTKSPISSSAPNQLEFDLGEADEAVLDDPFDTGFVERILPATAVADDEFDPRAGDSAGVNNINLDLHATEVATDSIKTPHLFSEEYVQPCGNTRASVTAKDLLSENSPELAEVAQLPLFDCVNNLGQNSLIAASVSHIDPFDTSRVEFIVAPGKTELKFLEEELLSNTHSVESLKHSLSDPNFDPRADYERDNTTTVRLEEEEHNWPGEEFQSIAQRKSSLCLQINEGLSVAGATNRSKSVVFAVPTPDLLEIDVEHPVVKKPLTPYYNRETTTAHVDADPFDTSFVISVAPTQLELNLLDQELNSVTLRHTISDNDFDPRSEALTITPQIKDPSSQNPDLLGISDENEDQQKVLTPADLRVIASTSDPFDTSIAFNLQPGRAELKLLEDELIPPPEKNNNLISDILSDGALEDSSVFVKILTPQVSSTSFDIVSEPTEIDPFDTSFVPSLGPGKAEIKVLESELISAANK